MAGKISMKALVSWNQFIWESKTRHERSFFEPENCTEWSRKEDSFNSSKSNKSFMEWFLFVHPFHCPIGLFFNHINILNGIKQISLLVLIFDISVNQERVCLWMNVFHSNLETIETSCLRDLNFWTELSCKILCNDSVTGGKKCKHIFYEVLFIGIEFFPIFVILVEIDFISCPKWSEVLLVHFIDWMMLDWEKNEPLIVFFQEWLILVRSSENRVVWHR